MNLKFMTDVFRVGQQVRNPETWKNAGTMFATVTGLLGIAFAALRHFGYITVELTAADAEVIAGILISLGSLFHIIWTKITSKKVGVPGLDKAEPTRPVKAEELERPSTPGQSEVLRG